MVKLREYQERYIAGMREAFRSDRRAVLCAPTGAGKTVMFSYMAQKAVSKGSRVLIITDRKELFSQSDGALSRVGLKPELLNPKNKKFSFDENCYVGMLDTLARRLKKAEYQLWLQTIDVIILDEAHKGSFDKLFRFFRSTSFVIGATATPWRTGKQRALREFYGGIVQAADTPDIIRMGFLSKCKTYGVPVDLSGVKTKMGDYDEKGMADRFSEIKLFHGVLDNYNRITPGQKALIFAPNLDSSKELVEDWQSKGMNARHVDCYMSEIERIEIIEWFKSTKGAILSNYGILTTGFDCPDIEVVILYRATKSLPLFLQMVGRGSRITDTKRTFTLLDFGNNVRTHGFWESPREWSLDKQEKKKSDKDSEMAIRECSECSFIMPATTRVCPECGHERPLTEKERIAAKLEEMTPEEIHATKDFDVLEAIAEKRGYNKMWVARQCRTAQEVIDYGIHKRYSPGWAHRKIKEWGL